MLGPMGGRRGRMTGGRKAKSPKKTLSRILSYIKTG